MLDTVKYRLHGCNQQKKGVLTQIKSENLGTSNKLVPSHNELFNKMLTFENRTFTISKIKKRDISVRSDLTHEDFVAMNTTKQINEHYLTLNQVDFISEKVERTSNLSAKGTYRIDSSQPNVVFKINIDGGFIDFEFSIPKYIYTHNLAQFIPQGGSRRYFDNPTGFSSWKSQRDCLYERFEKFTDVFFTELFTYFDIDKPVDYTYVELRRLDLCYNQYFNTPEEKRLYLEAQKKIALKSKRKNQNVSSNYDTSIAYHTQNGSYFKIYDKGAEYSSAKNGDLKKHLTINKAYTDNSFNQNQYYKQNRDLIYEYFKRDVQGKSLTLTKEEKEKLAPIIDEVHYKLPFDVDFYKKEMDKVLRYEISISSQTLSHYYKNYIFRKNCKIHRREKRTYKRVKRIYNNVDLRKRMKVPNWERSKYKHFHDFMNRGIGIVLSKDYKLKHFVKKGNYNYDPERDIYKITKFYEDYQLKTILEKKDVGVFSKDFLNLLVDNFYQKIQSYQIKELQPYDNLLDKFILYNENVEKNIEQYNKFNHWRTKDLNGNSIIKGNKVITKATQLLTEAQKRKNGLKKIDISRVAEPIRLMTGDDALSLDEVFTRLRLSKYQKHRIKKSFELVKINEQTIKMKKFIKPNIDFSYYYSKTKGLLYRQKFYFKKYHYNYS